MRIKLRSGQGFKLWCSDNIRILNLLFVYICIGAVRGAVMQLQFFPIIFGHVPILWSLFPIT